MIQVSVFKKNSIVTGIQLNGHAGYAEYGQDIVCAAVSVLVLNTINSIENFTTDLFEVSSDEESGYIEFQFQSTIGPESQLLMNSLVLGLQGVAEEYGKDYIKLILKEV